MANLGSFGFRSHYLSTPAPRLLGDCAIPIDFLLFLLKQSYSICEQLHILLRSLTRYTLVSQRTTKCTVELSWLIQLILPLSVILLRRSAFLLLVFAWVLQILWQRLTLLLDGIPCNLGLKSIHLQARKILPFFVVCLRHDISSLKSHHIMSTTFLDAQHYVYTQCQC